MSEVTGQHRAIERLDVGVGTRLIQGPPGHMAVLTIIHVSDAFKIEQVTLFKYDQGRWVTLTEEEVKPGDKPIFNRALDQARSMWEASGYMG